MRLSQRPQRNPHNSRFWRRQQGRDRRFKPVPAFCYITTSRIKAEWKSSAGGTTGPVQRFLLKVRD